MGAECSPLVGPHWPRASERASEHRDLSQCLAKMELVYSATLLLSPAHPAKGDPSISRPARRSFIIRPHQPAARARGHRCRPLPAAEPPKLVACDLLLLPLLLLLSLLLALVAFAFLGKRRRRRDDYSSRWAKAGRLKLRRKRNRNDR